MKVRLTLVLAAVGLVTSVLAQDTAKWIWFPGDREITLGTEVQQRRIERGVPCAVIWPEYSHWRQVTFRSPVITVEKATRVRVWTEGAAYFYLEGRDNKAFSYIDGWLSLPEGRYILAARVYNRDNPPSIFIPEGPFKTDSNWTVEWSSVNRCRVATSPECTTPETPPSVFKMAREHREPVSCEVRKDGTFADFGRETIGFVQLSKVKGKGRVRIVYGESREEAEAGELADVWEDVDVEGDKELPVSRAFRFIRTIRLSGDVTIGHLSMDFEYLPMARRGKFMCNDEEVNRIWEVAADTLHLATREFMLDGIKRDRWVWSGDARQSVNMAAYVFADDAVVKRTLSLLGGKDPIGAHINTILDYTLFWVISVGEYYQYSGDAEYVKEIWPRIKAWMAYCQKQTNPEGFLCDKPGDWVFIDWSPRAMTRNGGAASFEQILYVEALRVAADAAMLVGDKNLAKEYRTQSTQLREKILPTYWSEQQKGLLSFRFHNGQVREMTRYPNIFGLFYNYFTPEQRADVVKNVLENDAVMPIVTPYMRYYELESLCVLDRQADVLPMIKSYWGGMLKAGATSFWEEYDPKKSGTAHYAMYGRPFGKSLCHAWGASPVYLLGRYYLGVKPTSPGYATYDVKPNLGGLKWMEGTVPTARGDITVRVDGETVRITSPDAEGRLILPSGKTCKIPSQATTVFSLKD